MKLHTFRIRIADEPGELARVTGVFAGRGLNIDRLNVAPTEEPDVSEIVLVTLAAERVAGQVIKQLQRLVRVQSVDVLIEPQSARMPVLSK